MRSADRPEIPAKTIRVIVRAGNFITSHRYAIPTTHHKYIPPAKDTRLELDTCFSADHTVTVSLALQNPLAIPECLTAHHGSHEVAQPKGCIWVHSRDLRNFAAVPKGHFPARRIDQQLLGQGVSEPILTRE